jgi:immunoglobulin-binding protein 1
MRLTSRRPKSAAEPTRKEQLAIDAEKDGTREGGESAEEKRQEDEKWARFTDENPRGSGNTMNRG